MVKGAMSITGFADLEADFSQKLVIDADSEAVSTGFREDHGSKLET